MTDDQAADLRIINLRSNTLRQRLHAIAEDSTVFDTATTPLGGRIGDPHILSIHGSMIIDAASRVIFA